MIAEPKKLYAGRVGRALCRAAGRGAPRAGLRRSPAPPRRRRRHAAAAAPHGRLAPRRCACGTSCSTEEDRLHEAVRCGQAARRHDEGPRHGAGHGLSPCRTSWPSTRTARGGSRASWSSSTRLLEIADSLGIDDSFCPVRAMLGAFVSQAHFPMPDLLTCSVGATCDDFSAIAQRLEAMGHPILWWEMPHRRAAGGRGGRPSGCPAVSCAPQCQVDLRREPSWSASGRRWRSLPASRLTDERLAAGIARANRVRRLLTELRQLVFTAAAVPAARAGNAHRRDAGDPFLLRSGARRSACSRICWPRSRRRVAAGVGVLAGRRGAGLLGQSGGRPAGDEPAGGRPAGGSAAPSTSSATPWTRSPRTCRRWRPWPASALADPMVGSRPIGRRTTFAARSSRSARRPSSISRIPGASHCALEGRMIADAVRAAAGAAGPGDRSAADHRRRRADAAHAARGPCRNRTQQERAMICRGN